MAEQPLRVLVVDDTVVYRRVLQNVVAEIAGAEVVGIAANGRIALDRLEQLEVDVVLLDVEMPELGGLDTLREIRRRWPAIGVVLLSGADRHSADTTMRALELGALDFVPKAETGDVQRNQKQLVGQLSGVFRGFTLARQLKVSDRASLRLKGGQAMGASGIDRTSYASSASGTGAETKQERRGMRSGEPTNAMPAALGHTSLFPYSGVSVRAVPKQVRSLDVLLIGCSTGGPQALAKVIPALPSDFGIPVLVVQHMPPVFTASLAESLNRISKVTVVEGSENAVVLPNTVYIAPGGRHMAVRFDRSRNEKRIVLSDDDPVNSVRPSVDVLFVSAVLCYGGSSLSVILTGMGEDGLEGVKALRACGGMTLTQNEASCVVYGMPRAIDQVGLSDASVPLDELSGRIVFLVRQSFRHRSAAQRGGADG
jgi:two-component system chemotaxis response regulator CheB